MLEVKKVMEHYEIFVNGSFYRSCDVNELSQTLDEIEKELKDE